MQRSFRRQWKQIAKNAVGDGKGQKAGNFGFNDPDYARRVCPLVYMSNFAAWPESDGLNNQYEWFGEDMTTWLIGLGQEFHKLRPKRKNNRLPKWPKALRDTEPISEPSPDWMEYA